MTIPLIRQEKTTDFKQIYEVVRQSFANVAQSDKNEQDLVERLRAGDTYIPELALVAKRDEVIVGYIMFTKVLIDTSEELALAPLAVAPEYQKQGIGGMLIKAGHNIARELGYHYSIVLGSEKYYRRFGYEQADTFDILAPFDVPPENFMVYELQKSKHKISGIVQYPRVFFE